MKLFKYFFIILFLVLSVKLFSQTIILPDSWKFKTGDSTDYSNPNFNDSPWTLLDVPDYWENEGFEGYDGIAWYRVHFTINKKIMEDSVNIILGKIDDADETFLNGIRIGGMGSFPPNAKTAYDKFRSYKIPVSLLKKDNVLAVRVFDMGGPGGIVSGPIGIYDEKDYQKEFNPPPGPKKSFYQLVTSNGLIAAVYNEKRENIESVRPYIFQAFDSANFVGPILKDLKVNIKSRPLKTFYKENTHVITVKYPSLEVNYFASFTNEDKVFYIDIIGSSSKVSSCSINYKLQKTNVLIDSVLFKRTGDKSEKYFLISYTDSLQTDNKIIAKAKENLIKNKENLLSNEIEFMKKIFARAKIPNGISVKQHNLIEQSISVLKMAQVPSEGTFHKGRGQILASLPPGGWNIAWVRDGCYSILGLNKLGLFSEARNALSFMLRAESGHYIHYIFKDGKDYGVGVPYQVSVCRYFGDGKEESDYNDDGPNIELDGFGLSLIALCDYVERSGDTVFFNQNYELLSTKVADAIIHCIEKNNLIRIDSGPWERHLPGKQFAYTSIACAAGLRDFAALSSKLNIGNSKKYFNAYKKLLKGIKSELVVDNRFIKGNAEASDSTTHDYFDGATFEAFGFGLLKNKKLFYSQLAEYKRKLGVEGGMHGFSRINGGDWYDTSEWIFLDLRAASAMHKYGDKKDARKMINWITNQAALNFNLIPELFNSKTSFYEGSVPMVGFGAGAYAIALSDAYR